MAPAPGDPLAVEQDATRGRREDAGDAVEEGRLARAVRSDQADDLPFRQLQRDPSKRLDSAKTLHDVDSLQNAGGDLRAGCQRAHQATLRRFAGAFQRVGETPELVLAHEPALLRSELLHTGEKLPLGLVVQIEPELGCL